MDKLAFLLSPEFTPVIQQDGAWWIEWFEEVPGVNCQERTLDTLIETLVITLNEALEFNRKDCRGE